MTHWSTKAQTLTPNWAFSNSAATLIARQKMRYLYLTTSLLVAGALLIAFYSSNSGFNVLSFDPNAKASPTPIEWTSFLAAAFGMLLGILFGVTYEALWRERSNSPVGRVVRDALLSSQTTRAIVVAPMIFSGVYLVAKQEPDIIVAALFAFQNGFFCEKIFRERNTQSSQTQ